MEAPTEGSLGHKFHMEQPKRNYEEESSRVESSKINTTDHLRIIRRKH